MLVSCLYNISLGLNIFFCIRNCCIIFSERCVCVCIIFMFPIFFNIIPLIFMFFLWIGTDEKHLELEGNGSDTRCLAAPSLKQAGSTPAWMADCDLAQGCLQRRSIPASLFQLFYWTELAVIRDQTSPVLSPELGPEPTPVSTTHHMVVHRRHTSMLEWFHGILLLCSSCYF